MSALNTDAVENIGKILVDTERPLKERFRALFTLRNLGGDKAIECIERCFGDSSALLKHECAYCLGQMQDTKAIPVLLKILEDKHEDAMVRHEAGEALGAIGSQETLELLQNYASDPVVEVAETCQLAVERIRWLHSSPEERENLPANPYMSVDPAPPCENNDTDSLTSMLLDESLPLFQRYRAMFALRNRGNTESVEALAKGLTCSSALFRHEIAYVLGQIQHEAATQQLTRNLENPTENYMVRHECAEALGAIATEECMEVLKKYVADPERVVRESCEVALDMCDYETGDQFQYADSLSKVAS